MLRRFGKAVHQLPEFLFQQRTGVVAGVCACNFRVDGLGILRRARGWLINSHCVESSYRGQADALQGIIKSSADAAAAAAAAATAAPTAAAVTALAFDVSGLFLASGGADGSLVTWGVKEDYAALATHKDCAAAVTGLSWSRAAHTLYAVSLDRTLRVYGE
jgi:hypothetical protein